MAIDHEEEEAIIIVTEEKEQFAILVKKIKNRARITGIWWSVYFKFFVFLMMLCVQVPNLNGEHHHGITTKGYISLYGISIAMYMSLWAHLLSNERLLNMTFDRASSSASLQPAAGKSLSLTESDVTYIKCLYVPTWISFYLFVYLFIMSVFFWTRRSDYNDNKPVVNNNTGGDGGNGHGITLANTSDRFFVLWGVVWVLMVILIVHYKRGVMRSLINDLKAFVVAPTRAASADACCITAIRELNKQRAKHVKIRQGWNDERSKLQKMLDDAKNSHRSIHSLP